MESLEDERIISLKIENATLKENIEVSFIIDFIYYKYS